MDIIIHENGCVNTFTIVEINGELYYYTTKQILDLYKKGEIDSSIKITVKYI